MSSKFKKHHWDIFVKKIKDREKRLTNPMAIQLRENEEHTCATCKFLEKTLDTWREKHRFYCRLAKHLQISKKQWRTEWGACKKWELEK